MDGTKAHYDGPLLGASNGNNRVQHKNDIRRVLHGQLKRFWQNSRLLSQRTDRSLDGSLQVPYNEVLAEKFALGGFGFVPLVTESLSLSCSLDILFLRPMRPGGVIVGGDIDNRLKTLFDALRKPQNTHELTGLVPEEDEPFFYCLLEDDRLINRVSIETDALLEPVGDGEPKDNDARLVITVKILPYRSGLGNLDFIGN